MMRVMLYEAAQSMLTRNQQVVLAGNHIWADRYDGELADVFALQDEVTKKVVAAIEPKLLEAEALRSQSRSAEDLGAAKSAQSDRTRLRPLLE